MKVFRYTTIGSVVGLMAIGALQLPKSAAEQAKWQKTAIEQQALEQRALLEQRKAELAKETAEAYAKNQILYTDALQLQGYTLGEQPPPGVDWSTFVDPSRKVIIYDQHRACIGHAYAGRFNFVKTDPSACQGAYQQ